MTYSNNISLGLREERPKSFGDPREPTPGAFPHPGAIAESPEQQTRRRRPLRSGHGVGETAETARHPLPGLLIEHLLDHFHHPIHLGAASDHNHPAADLFVETDLLDIAVDEFGNLCRAWLENVRELVLGKDFRRTAADGRHFDRVVFRHQRTERAAIALLNPLR